MRDTIGWRLKAALLRQQAADASQQMAERWRKRGQNVVGEELWAAKQANGYERDAANFEGQALGHAFRAAELAYDAAQPKERRCERCSSSCRYRHFLCARCQFFASQELERELAELQRQDAAARRVRP